MENNGIYLFKLAYVDEGMPLTDCNRDYSYEINLCCWYENAYKYVNPRTMLITSQYDSWVIYNGTDIDCVIDGKAGKTLT
jgi:hypothetical protein